MTVKESAWSRRLLHFFLASFGFILLRFALIPSRYQTEFIVIYATIVGASAASIIIDSLHWRHFFVLLGLLWGLMLAGHNDATGPRRLSGVARSPS